MPESPASPTPYEVLGVSASASQEDLRRAYRRLLRLTHPDTGGSPAQFHAVQLAWERVGDPGLRAEYDRGHGAPDVTPDARPAGTAHPGAAQRRAGSSPKARSYGHPGGQARERFLALMRQWSGRAGDLENPYDPALVRSAPPEIRRMLAKALAEEETARLVSVLGIGYTIWNAAAVPDSDDVIDHVVLGPAGLFAVRSEDWGAPVRLLKGEVVGDGLDRREQPVKTLVRGSRRLARSVGARFTGHVIVVPDDALAEPIELVGRGRHASTALVRRSLLPQLLRNGLAGDERVSVSDVFEVRTRLQNGIRLV
jgi:molecular chaperone DnaJ